jgi:hypothetical protein
VARLSFYLDEHIQSSVTEALKARGVDVLTTQEAGNVGKDDENQLIFATKSERVLFSYNKRHFAKIHYEWMVEKKPHNGIILSDQLPVGMILRRLMKLYFSLASGDMKNRLEYLSVWR